MSWTEVFGATEGEVAPAARPRFDAAAKQMCWYGRTSTKEFVGVQFDKELMTKEEFVAAQGDGEILDEPGVVASFNKSPSDTAGGSKAALSMVLNEEGDTLSLVVSGREITKDQMVAAGRAMAEDF